MTEQYKKQNLNLPEDVATLLRTSDLPLRDAYVARLFDAGWTQQSLARGACLSRERVRQITSRARDAVTAEAVADWPLPDRPLRGRPRPFASKAEVSAVTLARLLELQPIAQKVRSSTKHGRLEAEEYTALLDYAVRVEGVPVYRLAKSLGLTHNAVRFRLMRYGYVAAPDTRHRVYQPMASANRPA
jgi:hypothetical protein